MTKLCWMTPKDCRMTYTEVEGTPGLFAPADAWARLQARMDSYAYEQDETRYRIGHPFIRQGCLCAETVPYDERWCHDLATLHVVPLVTAPP
jgi:hypothetical protein